MSKIRLTESQLHNIVKESINKVLQEGWFGNVIDTVFNGGQKQEQERQQFLLDRKIGIIENLLSKGDFNKAREIASAISLNGLRCAVTASLPPKPVPAITSATSLQGRASHSYAGPRPEARK